MIKRLYPGGRAKAFVLCYDDGVLQDRPLVELLNRYGLKGTFNLNSGLMEREFAWTHPSGAVVRRLPLEAAAELYRGHEVACHSLTHPYMDNLSDGELWNELARDKENLERLLGREIVGFAVPFDYYDGRIGEYAARCGFSYVRTPEETRSFTPPEDSFNWKAGIFHLAGDLPDFVDAFLETYEELALCQIVGHSYDLDTENRWGVMEEIFRKVSADRSALSMTTAELIGYLRAMRAAEVTENRIVNPGGAALWFEINGRVCEVGPYAEIEL